MRLLLTITIAALLSAAASVPAVAQTNSDQDLRAGLLDMKMSGPEGSLKVAEMFAQCHGFQSALYEDLTKDIVLKLDDSDFASNIGEQAMIDGHMAFLSSVSHTPDPKGYVNDISQAEQDHWANVLSKPGDKDPLVWEKLSLCQKIAPMSRYFVEELRNKR